MKGIVEALAGSDGVSDSACLPSQAEVLLARSDFVGVLCRHDQQTQRQCSQSNHEGLSQSSLENAGLCLAIVARAAANAFCGNSQAFTFTGLPVRAAS